MQNEFPRIEAIIYELLNWKDALNAHHNIFKRPYTKGYVLYDSIYMKYPE